MKKVFLPAMLLIPLTLAPAMREPLITQKLVDAIIQVESSGRPRVVSSKGAVGLMQVRPAVWKRELQRERIIKTRKCLFDPEKNINAGVYILAKYLKAAGGDLRRALEKYSGGARGYYEKVMKAKGR
jgi:soluble lytic murein transglycosylase-like protein